MLLWKEAFQFVRNRFSSILEKKLVRFSPSEDWRLLILPYSFKIFSVGIPEEHFDFSGGEGPLMICRKQDQSHCLLFFPPSKFSRFQHDHLHDSERLESVVVKLCYSLFIVLWNWFSSSSSWNSEIILVGFNQKECRTFSSMYVIFKVPLRAHLAAWGCPALPQCCSVCCKASARNTQVCSLQSKY